MSGERVGQVQLMCGDTVKVSVDIETGQTEMWIASRDARYTNWPARVRVDEIAKIVDLLEFAAKVSPAIKAAHEVRQRAVQTAEATYERIVANVIGRSQ